MAVVAGGWVGTSGALGEEDSVTMISAEGLQCARP